MIHWSAVALLFVMWVLYALVAWRRECINEKARDRLERMVWARTAGEFRALDPEPPKPKPGSPEQPRPMRARDQILVSTPPGLRPSSGRGTGGGADS